MLKILDMTVHLLSRAKNQSCYPEKGIEKQNLTKVFFCIFEGTQHCSLFRLYCQSKYLTLNLSSKSWAEGAHVFSSPTVVLSNGNSSCSSGEIPPAALDWSCHFQQSYLYTDKCLALSFQRGFFNFEKSIAAYHKEIWKFRFSLSCSMDLIR